MSNWRQLSVRVAAMVFLGMAVLGSLCGLGPYPCGMRALGGAGVALAVMAVLRRMAEAILSNPAPQRTGAEDRADDDEHGR